MKQIISSPFSLIKTFFQRPQPRHKRKQIWLVSLLDLITLVLCFFVMLYSMSSPNWKNESPAMPSELTTILHKLFRPDVPSI